MKLKIFIISIFISQFILAQVPVASNVFLAKEFSKDIALYKAKEFVMKDVLGVSDKAMEFEIFPLAATNSGELTTLVYKSKEKSSEGLVFGFYSDNWNSAGVIYKAYAFKKLEDAKALEVLQKISNILIEHDKFIGSDIDNNNVYFKYDDITFLIYIAAIGDVRIRVFWNNFDAEWEYTAFKRTKKRLIKKLD